MLFSGRAVNLPAQACEAKRHIGCNKTVRAHRQEPWWLLAAVPLRGPSARGPRPQRARPDHINSGAAINAPTAAALQRSGGNCPNSRIAKQSGQADPAPASSVSRTVIPLWLASRSIRDILENFRVRRRASRSETPDRRGTDMVGVFSSLEAVIIISRSRGMPSVTLAPAPAR